MPVPVPIVPKPLAHQVGKSTLQARGDRHASAASFVRNDAFKYVIQDVCRQSATSAPYREGEDIYETPPLWLAQPNSHSLNCDYASAHYHERRILGDLSLLNGLTVAESAAGNKQRRAEACHSPVHTFPAASAYPAMGLQSFDERRRSSEATWPCLDQGNGIRRIPFTGAHYGHIPESSAQGNGASLGHHDGHGLSTDDAVYNVQPNVTPFADYVDRAVGEHFEAETHKRLPPVETPRRQQPPTTEPLTDAAYIKAYRDMSEPLSEWVADYVWKVCTQGLSLPPHFVTIGFAKRYSEKAPASLARSVQSVLCSTLLQPSAIVLALWYIARLPVFFDWQARDVTVSLSEQEFRDELLRIDPVPMSGDERGTLEFQAPFRLIVLGCMLANKWLDDHTFSNRTWHTISEIPIRSINRLELLALALFAQDLSVPPQAWDQWLTHLRHYQLISSPYPAPIRRPSTADNDILIRKFIDDLAALQGKSDVNGGSIPPRPVFSPLLNTDAEKTVTSETTSVGSYEIDLDEDGPLRAEYVPKRRTSQSRSISSFRNSSDMRSSVHIVPQLPPPSEWSPQADPPVGERRGRRETYLPVQPHFGPSGQVSHTRSFSMEHTTLNSVWSPFKTQELLEAHRPYIYQAFVFPSALPAACPPISYTRSTSSPPSALISNLGDIRPRSHFYADEGYSTSISCGQHIGYPPTFAHSHAEPAHFQLRSLWLRT